MRNLEKEEPEGGTVSPGGIDSLRDQVEAPYHACSDLFFIPDPLLQFPAGQ